MSSHTAPHRTATDYMADATEDLARLHLVIGLAGRCDAYDLADALTRCERYAASATPQDRREYHDLRADLEASAPGSLMAHVYAVQRDTARGVIV